MNNDKVLSKSIDNVTFYTFISIDEPHVRTGSRKDYFYFGIIRSKAR